MARNKNTPIQATNHQSLCEKMIARLGPGCDFHNENTIYRQILRLSDTYCIHMAERDFHSVTQTPRNWLFAAKGNWTFYESMVSNLRAIGRDNQGNSLYNIADAGYRHHDFFTRENHLLSLYDAYDDDEWMLKNNETFHWGDCEAAHIWFDQKVGIVGSSLRYREQTIPQSFWKNLKDQIEKYFDDITVLANNFVSHKNFNAHYWSDTDKVSLSFLDIEAAIVFVWRTLNVMRACLPPVHSSLYHTMSQGDQWEALNMTRCERAIVSEKDASRKDRIKDAIDAPSPICLPVLRVPKRK